MIYKQIKEKIFNQYIKVADKTGLIPSERSLSEKYEVSRPTIRKALTSLEQDGLITKDYGRGYIINQAVTGQDKYVDHELSTFIGFFEDAEHQQKPTSSKVLQQSVEYADENIAKKLNLEKGDPIFVLSRIRYIKETPMCVARSYIPLKFDGNLINQDFSKKSLFTALKDNGLKLNKAKRTIEVVREESPDYLYLKIDKSEPILKFTSIGYTKKGIPFEYEESRYPAYKVKFESTVC